MKGDFSRIIPGSSVHKSNETEGTGLGRPRGAPTKRKEFRLEERQIEYLEALIATSALGRPPLVSLVRQAVDEFLRRELAKPDVRARVERFLREQGKVVKLREGKKQR